MKHKKTLRRGLSILLSVLLCLTLVPATALAAEGDVEINATNFPDETFREMYVRGFDTDGSGTLNAAEIAAVTVIDCNNQYYKNESITSLKGIEYFTALTKLDCYFNRVSSLDVSKNTKLQSLNCKRNQMTSLIVSGAADLQSLVCYDNQLTSLDVSNNKKLTELDCCYNKLTSLTVSGAANLETLVCHDNQLTSLDVSNNKALTYLDCRSNQLTTLDVSKNTDLGVLYCASNHLTSLDVNNNTKLWAMNFSPNTYKVTTLGENRTFDLSELPKGFDVNKASDWTGGKASGNTLTFDPDAMKVTYTYNCGNEKTATFTLDATPQYTITFDANGGSVTPASAETGENVKLSSLPIPTREGYRFDGWFTAAEEGTAVTKDTVFDGNTTIYAHWTKIYTITFNANGGTLPGESTTEIDEGGMLTSLPTPTCEGYRFDGWFTAAEEGTAVTKDTVFNQDTTLYAHWTKISTITFDANGGSGEMADVTEVSGSYTLPACDFTAPEGKQFKGWATSEAGEVITEGSIDVTDNTTLYAIWENKPISGGGYIPTVQKPTIDAGEGVKVTLSADGKTATITVDDGYEIADVVLNGISLGKVTEVKNLKTGDKLVVTAEKKAAEPTKEELQAILDSQKLVARSKIVTLKNGKKAVKITWTDENGESMDFDGVEIYRSTKRYSGYGKTPFFITEKDVYYNTAIEAGNTYYYKVRGYIERNGEKIYTDWSMKAIRTVE